MKKPLVLARSAVMRGAATVGQEYPEIRGALPSSAGILVTWIVRAFFADEPAVGEAHLQALETIFMMRKRAREGVPMYDPKTGAPTAVGVHSHSARMRSSANEAWAYLEANGIVAEPAPPPGVKRRKPSGPRRRA